MKINEAFIGKWFWRFQLGVENFGLMRSKVIMGGTRKLCLEAVVDVHGQIYVKDLSLLLYVSTLGWAIGKWRCFVQTVE